MRGEERREKVEKEKQKIYKQKRGRSLSNDPMVMKEKKNVEKMQDGDRGIFKKLCQVGQLWSVKPSEHDSQKHNLRV